MELNKIRYKILVVGCGGTGGYFLKEFSHYLNGDNDKIAGLYMIDGDIVEAHNVSRQCFQLEDVGQPKAAILGSILNENFETSWSAICSFITSKEQIASILNLKNNEVPLIIGCVDNHGCRLILEDYFKSVDNCIYFDSANEIYSGEVVCTYKLNGKQISPLRSEAFPDILKGDTRNVTELSCEELNVVLPQHIMVNLNAGFTLLSRVVLLLEESGIRPGITFFDAKELTSQYSKIVWEENHEG